MFKYPSYFKLCNRTGRYLVYLEWLYLKVKCSAKHDLSLNKGWVAVPSPWKKTNNYIESRDITRLHVFHHHEWADRRIQDKKLWAPFLCFSLELLLMRGGNDKWVWGCHGTADSPGQLFKMVVKSQFQGININFCTFLFFNIGRCPVSTILLTPNETVGTILMDKTKPKNEYLKVVCYEPNSSGKLFSLFSWWNFFGV